MAYNSVSVRNMSQIFSCSCSSSTTFPAGKFRWKSA